MGVVDLAQALCSARVSRPCRVPTEGFPHAETFGHSQCGVGRRAHNEGFGTRATTPFADSGRATQFVLRRTLPDPRWIAKLGRFLPRRRQ